MMQWKRERDLLVAQTLAFVQSVAGMKGDAGNADARIEHIKPDIEGALIDAIKLTAPPDTSQAFNNLQTSKNLQAPGNPQVSRVNVGSEVRAEMQARVANFRKHQERFHRDRDQYYSATLAKLRAAIGNDVSPPAPRK
jgi:hypothetical protein